MRFVVTARGRYRRLLERCPQVVQMLSLKGYGFLLRQANKFEWASTLGNGTSPRSCVPLVASGKAERLKISPIHLSKIRKELTFGQE